MVTIGPPTVVIPSDELVMRASPSATENENLMGIDQRVLDRDFVFRAGG